MTDQIEITLKKSWIATTPNQKENLRGLGLFRREIPVLRPDTASIRGMVQKVIHLVEVRPAQEKRSKAFSGPWVTITPPQGEPENKTAKKPKAGMKPKAEAPKMETAAKNTQAPKPISGTKAPKAAKTASSVKKEKTQ